MTHKEMMEEDADGGKDARFATNNVMIDLMKGVFLLKALGEHCCITDFRCYLSCGRRRCDGKLVESRSEESQRCQRC